MTFITSPEPIAVPGFVTPEPVSVNDVAAPLAIFWYEVAVIGEIVQVPPDCVTVGAVAEGGVANNAKMEP